MKHDAWENALFVHWPVDPAFLAAHLPQGLEPDIHEGQAWVGLVLLTERGVLRIGRKLVPPIDHIGANVRTYVRRGDVPGIFFWSLECSSVLASIGARLAGIPYFPATMRRTVDVERPVSVPGARGSSDGCLQPQRGTCEGAAAGGAGDSNQQAGDGFVFDFASQRSGLRARRPTVSARWRLAAEAESAEERDVFHARARWFVERYSVYAAWPWGRGPVLLRGDVQHPSWTVQPAVLEKLEAAPLLEAAGLQGVCDGPEAQKPHVCFSRGAGPVEFWMLEPV
eukprot:CAMPEP_0171258006 /NCGR_PEP_ID=MMETSP0790-20130122/54150_1 /TAXON_ID=2925 /ORGANISM="Alexandrium catenella, Strain OF101" /LENGTH=281 /DNA_ID=CAMNT_0011726157 /DNA_START=24 /DNA_END=870 /DNA_ORIENTATION=-